MAAWTPLALALLSVAACAPRPAAPRLAEHAAPAATARPPRKLAVAPSGETLVLEIAATAQERALGLMGRSEVPRGTGMIFLFDAPAREGFWMKNCLVALDIAWLDEHGVVVHLGEKLPPCRQDPCPTYEPSAPAAMVIEVGAGEARRLGMVPGARMVVKDLDR